MPTAVRLLTAAVSLACLAACDQDPLGLSERAIGANYVLERAESNYFLIDANHPDTVGGVIEGVVLAIGWDQQRIVVERHSIFRGDPDGFLIIDLKTRAMRGPLTREALTADPEVGAIKLLPAAQAWESLH